MIEITTPRGTIRGMLHIPETEGPHPLVVIYHGFLGNRIQSGRLLLQFSRFLKEKGIMSLRCDFLGSGESDGDFIDATFSKEMQEANWIMDWALTHSPWNKEDLFFVGHSMGGAISASIARQYNDLLTGAILWAPPSHLETEFDKILEEHQPVHFPQDLGGQYLSREFYEDAVSVKVLDFARRYSGPLAVIHGDEDTVVSHRVTEDYSKVGAEVYILLGGKHSFTSVEHRKELFDKTFFFLNKWME